MRGERKFSFRNSFGGEEKLRAFLGRGFGMAPVGGRMCLMHSSGPGQLSESLTGRFLEREKNRDKRQE